MVKLIDLVHEIHERSIWQVMLVYVGGSWAMLDRIDMAESRFGLPAWVFGAAFILLVLGLIGVATIAAWPKIRRRELPPTPPSEERPPEMDRREILGEPGAAPASPHVFMPRSGRPARITILTGLAFFVVVLVLSELMGYLAGIGYLPEAAVPLTLLLVVALWPTSMILAFILTYRSENRLGETTRASGC